MIYQKSVRLILFAIIFISLTSLTSCLKDEKEDEKAYNSNNPVSVQALVDAFYKPFESVNLLDKNFGEDGEYVLYGLNSRLNSQTESELISDHLATLVNIREEKDRFVFTYEYAYDNYHDDEDVKVINYSIPFDKQTGAQLKTASHPAEAFKKQFVVQTRHLLEKQEVVTQNSGISFDINCQPTDNLVCVLFFDLTLQNTQKKAPKAFEQRGCPGLPDCQLNVLQLNYKQVVRIKGQPEQVTGHTQEFSAQIPFISAFNDDYFNNISTSPLLNGSLSHCYDFWIRRDDGNNIFAKQCTYLKDFSYGSMD